MLSFPSFLHLSYRSRWLYWLTVPWIVPLFGYLLLGRAYWQQLGAFVGSTALLWLLASLWMLGLDRATTAVVRRFSRLDQTRQRVLLNTLACSGLSVLFLGVTTGLFGYFRPFGSRLTLHHVMTEMGVLPEVRQWLSRVLGLRLSSGWVAALLYTLDFVVILLLVLVYEVFYSLRKWQESKINMEHLRKASLQGQLQSLKNQINPHFLFNSLNSLSSLIADEPERAEQFVDEMAKVYRYLLQTNEEQLTPLAVELSFIDSYYHLLRTRHGSGLQLRVAVAPEHLAYQLPPLTLQMLVENAVKHNVILSTQPLRIDIESTPAGTLRVSNNLQRKTSRVDSNHVGLSNIAARYRLLAQQTPQVEAGPERFVVELPLLR